MEPEIIHLSVLTFLAGVFCKIYDDLNDNNLFEKHSFLLKNKEYINEMLKGLHYILLTYVSSKYIYPVIMFLFINIVNIIFDTNAYKMPYELSGMILWIIFGIYISIFNIESIHMNMNIIIPFLLIYFPTAYFFDIFICYMEFGYKKLIIRSLSALGIILLFLANYIYNFCPDEKLYYLWWLIGYFITSICFQLYLILDSEKNTIIKDKVKEELIVKDESVKHIATSAKV